MSKNRGIYVSWIDKSGELRYGEIRYSDQVDSVLKTGRKLVRHIKSLSDTSPVCDSQGKALVGLVRNESLTIKGYFD